MKELRLIITAAGLAMALSIFIIVRMNMQFTSFEHVVLQSLKTTEGYDQKLIEMVNRLEDELVIRASFGYKGGKDPMTGKTRMVVMPTPAQAPSRRLRSGTSAKAAPATPDQPVMVEEPIKLTAIIFDDDTRQHTAIIMDGERSMSVQVGDRVRDRVVARITADMVFMEGGGMVYKFDIYGNISSQKK